jgi:UDP-glucuronate decarboxylase
MTGSRSPIELMALPENDPKQRRPDIGRAREQLGWEPKVPLREGLVSTIGYFETLLSGPTPSADQRRRG